MNQIHPIIIELLRQRGITEEADIQEFLSEKPQITYDPFLLADMEAGVDFILSGIQNGDKICIYGDYDADGITSVSLLYQVLSELTDASNLSYYIPSRFEEGYGLNREAISAIRQSGAARIITVDCGSVSYEEVEYAKEIGMKIMVTDHHNITDRRADCILINPKRADCPYPYKQLAGVGVAFKLAQALQQRSGLPKSVLTGVLDLVAVGTIGDIVALTGENRTMVKYGMRVVNAGARPGLTQLIRGIGLTPGKVRPDHVAFAIVPHLNAAGRIQDARTAAELMMAREPQLLREGTETLIKNNRLRKELQEAACDECERMIASGACGSGQDPLILLLLPDAHEGITGIAAGRVKDAHHRPTILVTPSGEDGAFLKGTGRSIESVDLYRLLKSCEDLFLKFGGHAGACGFLMKKEHFEELGQRLNARVLEMLSENPSLLERRSEVDLELCTKDITEALADQLEWMQPFGHQNPRPIFAIPHARAKEIVRMGGEGQHLRFTAEDASGGAVQCVLFRRAEEVMPMIQGKQSLRFSGTVEEQVWNGRKRIQMILSEIEAEA